MARRAEPPTGNRPEVRPRKSASGGEVPQIAPPSGQAAFVPRSTRNKGQDGVHRRRAASTGHNCDAIMPAKRSGPAEGAAGPEGGGMRLSRSRFLL